MATNQTQSIELDDSETLTEALASLGLTHRPSSFHGRMIFDAAGGSLGEFDCFQGFDLVRRLRALRAAPVRG